MSGKTNGSFQSIFVYTSDLLRYYYNKVFCNGF